MKLASRIQNPESRICGPRTADRGPRTCNSLKPQVVLFIAAWIFLPIPAFAQLGSSGVWPIEIYGMVQVEPGSYVLTLAVKNEEIRFAVNDVRSSDDRRISLARFLSNTRYHTPSMHIRGSDALLDILIKEKPSKRVLRLTGLFYVDTRVFVVSGIIPFRERPKPPL